MNKRIKELADQCQKEVWGNSPYNGAPEFDGYELDVERFAELIVKECIRCCEGNSEYKNHTDTEWGKGLASGIGLCKEAMKTHFGVGE